MAFHVDSEVGVLKQVIMHALGRSALQRAPAAGGLSSLLESQERPALAVALHRELIRGVSCSSMATTQTMAGQT